MHWWLVQRHLPSFLATLFSLIPVVGAAPVITEFLASNVTGLTDEDGDFSDWIEIHNPDAAPANLAGWHLTDDAATPAKWTFPATTLAPGGYLVVFASSKDRANPAGQLHTNFKLTAGGEYLGLLAPDGITVATEFSPTFPPQTTDVSYGDSHPSEWITLFGPTSAAKTFVPINNAIDATWRANAFNDSGWTAGPLGVGFDTNTAGVNLNPLIGTNVRTLMYTKRTSVYVRVPFAISNPAEVLNLELTTQYEDGFTAHLNGVRLSEANAPVTTAWNSVATNTIYDSDGIPSITTDLTAARGNLVTGQNILAYQGLNINSSSSDLLVTGTLRARIPSAAEPAKRGFFVLPTPGLANGGNETLSLSETVVFSVPSKTFQGTLPVALTGAGAGQTIRYTTNGALPTVSSTLYSGSLTLSATAPLRARAFDATGASGPVASNQYTRLDAVVGARKSNLPMVILDARGQTLSDVNRVEGSLLLFDRDANGISDLSRVPEISTRQGIRLRGSSSQGQPKRPYSVEFWDESNNDRNLSVLGMTAESDWVFYAPYDFDRNYTRNSVIYDLARQMGRWAPNTRFVEVFYNSDGGDVTNSDYVGVYAIMEQIKLTTKRIGSATVDVASVPPAGPIDPDAQGNWTGGYLLKIDRPDSDEYSWKTAGNVPIFVAGTNNAVVLARPKLEDLDGGPYVSGAAAASGSRQLAFIQSYVQTFENALFTDRNNSFSSRQHLNYMERGSWVDTLIMASFAKNVDALRLSAFFYKSQNDKLVAGPVWDFDRSLNSRDTRDDQFNTWNGAGDATQYFTYDWWGALCSDPDFQQAFYDRWAELRKSVMSNANLTAVIDGYANHLNNSANGLGSAAQRDAQKWPSNAPRNNSYAVETDDMRSWALSRAGWMDGRRFDAASLPAVPAINVAGSQATLTGPATVYFTTDGSDPRASGGGVTGQAYSRPIALTGATHVIARSRVGGVWSTPAEADFSPPAPPSFIPGGDGDWTTNSNWTSNPAPYPNATGVSALVGPPSTGNRAVTLRAPVTIGGIKFAAGSSADRNRIDSAGAASQLTFQNSGIPAKVEVSGTGVGYTEFQIAAGTVLASSLEINVANLVGDPAYGALRLRETWSGPGGLVKTGAGVASLNGSGKNYSGATTIPQGVLIVTQSSVMANSPSVTVTDGGQLRLTSTGIPGVPASHTFGGDLFLSGIGRGAEIPEAQNLGKLGALRYDPGTTSANSAAVTNAIELSGLTDLHVDGLANTLTLSGAFRGTGNLRKSGGGTLEMTGANLSFAAPIEIQNGPLKLRGGVASAISVDVDGTLDLVGNTGALSGTGQLILSATAVSTPSVTGLKRSMVFRQPGDPTLAVPATSGNALIITTTPGTPLSQDFYVDLTGPIPPATRIRGGYLVPAAVATAPLVSTQVFVPTAGGPRSFAGKTWQLAPASSVTFVPATLSSPGGNVSGRILELRFDGQPLTYDAWKLANFTGPDLTNPAISGSDAVPFRDGIPNLLRYALAAPVGANAAASLPVLTVNQPGGITFQFPYDPGLRGLRWTVESTTNLADWSAPDLLFDSATDLRQPTPDGHLALAAPISGTRRFYRLRVATDASR